MTPGEDALREAARLETARVYTRTCPEHKQPKPTRTELADVTDIDEARRRRRTA